MYKQMYTIYGTEVVMHQCKLGLMHDLSLAHFSIWIFGDIISYPSEP